jgi:hypothetical protein
MSEITNFHYAIKRKKELIRRKDRKKKKKKKKKTVLEKLKLLIFYCNEIVSVHEDGRGGLEISGRGLI